MNKITISGKLTKNAELRYTSTSKAVVTLNIYESDEKTFLDITCWEDVAESSKDLVKDEAVYIEGYIRKRSYEDKDRKKVYITEIGIYDTNKNLVAIGKLNDPVAKDATISRTIVFAIDF